MTSTYKYGHVFAGPFFASGSVLGVEWGGWYDRATGGYLTSVSRQIVTSALLASPKLVSQEPLRVVLESEDSLAIELDIVLVVISRYSLLKQ